MDFLNPRPRREDHQRIHAPQPHAQVQPADARPSLITRILHLVEAAYYTSLAVFGRTRTHAALISFPGVLCLYLSYPQIRYQKPSPEVEELITELDITTVILALLVNRVQDLWWEIRRWRSLLRLIYAIGEWFGWRWVRRMDHWIRGWRERAGVEGIWLWLPGGE